MSPEDNRRILGILAAQIRQNINLTNSQLNFLEQKLQVIADGGSADQVLGLNFSKGQTDRQFQSRKRLSFIFHWIANAILPIDQDGLGLKVNDALLKASEWASIVFSNVSETKYDFSYLKNQWYNPANKHLHDPNRDPFDPDFPY